MSNNIIPVSENPLTHDEIVGGLQKIFRDYADKGDFESGFNLICELDKRGKSFDMAKAAGFSILESAWKPDQHEDETFLSAAVRRTGNDPITVRNHIKIRKLLDSGKIPDIYYENIEQSGVKSLIQIANVSEKFELEKNNWRALSEASGDERKVGMIVRKIKNVSPRSNFRGFTIDERGNITFFKGGQRAEIGKLYVSNKDVLVQEGIECANSRLGTLPLVEY